MKAVENVMNALLFSPKTHQYKYTADARDSFVIHRVVRQPSMKKDSAQLRLMLRQSRKLMSCSMILPRLKRRHQWAGLYCGLGMFTDIYK